MFVQQITYSITKRYKHHDSKQILRLNRNNHRFICDYQSAYANVSSLKKHAKSKHVFFQDRPILFRLSI
jgi:ribosomal protein L30/L7E